MAKKEQEANVVAVFRAALMRRAGRLEALETLWEILPQATRERVAVILNEVASLYAVIDARLYDADSEARLAVRRIREDGTAFDEVLRKLFGERLGGHARRDRLTSALVTSGLVTREEVLAFLSKQFGVPAVNLDVIEIPRDVVRSVPQEVARTHQLIVFAKTTGADTILQVAMADPTNIFAYDDVKFLTGCEIKVYVADEGAIQRAIDKYYAEPPPDEPPPPPAAAVA